MLELWHTVSPVLIPIYYVGIFFVVINMLLENRNPLKMHSYLLLLLLLPVAGLIIYLFFGQNQRKRKIFEKRRLINQAFGDSYLAEYIDRSERIPVPIEESPLAQYEKVIRFLSKDLSPLSQNNKVEILKNGEGKFPKVMEAVRNARHHIHLEYYIFSDDTVGDPLADLLLEKVKEGVKVRLIVDGVGSLGLKKAFFNKMRKGGVQIYEFMPVLFPSFTSKINYRNHRKIIVIDGHIGFTGGINFNDRYINNGTHPLYWRDTHLRLEGEVVKTLQFLFLLNWQFVSNEELKADENYFPDFTQTGNSFTQVNASGPDWELESIMDSFLLAINAAQRRVRIATPYFIPTESILDALVTAAKADIEIELMIPRESDSWIVQAASMSYIKVLLAAGIKVFLYQKGFLHSKVIMVDDNFASVGSANMDYRSFDLNHEVNTYLYEKALVQILIDQFEADKADCAQVDAKRWVNRSVPQKLKESICRLLAPLL